MNASAVGLAVALDATLREPPLRVHPVRAMGAVLDAAARHVPATPRALARRRGTLAWLAGLVAFTAAGRVIDVVAARLPRPAATVVQAVALWPLISLRMLLEEVAAVETALADGLDDARSTVARIVARPTATLDAGDVREAAIGSLTENLSDAWVAPLAWYATCGLAGAFAYRWINTADAMWGHRNQRWIDAGRCAARADDVANLVPARLTGLALAGGDVGARRLAQVAVHTPSPNAGWPMAAIAQRLGIRIGKPGVYVLNPDGRVPQAADTRRALRHVRRVAWLLAGVLSVAAAVARRTCSHARSRSCLH